jgi:hypothetical protein
VVDLKWNGRVDRVFREFWRARTAVLAAVEAPKVWARRCLLPRTVEKCGLCGFLEISRAGDFMPLWIWKIGLKWSDDFCAASSEGSAFTLEGKMVTTDLTD